MTELETKLLNIIADIRGLREEEDAASVNVQKLRDEAAEEEQVIADCKQQIRYLESEMEDIIAELTGDD